ncbi:LEC14B protein isoform X2 [Impatiens glandulifera]|uniref:LEC14B protein isoform X2 n=1 Tax=Impatiens glandulifera TaxID=253017 RepID=UPI001FB15086|nr:LEC14B protein isoform X2 [Impatiens glandulifera]
MGYAMSRLEMNSDLLCDSNMPKSEFDGNPRASNSHHLDHEVSHDINRRSIPSDHLTRVQPGKRQSSVSALKMLFGREANYSGRGKFSSADCCHVLSRYLPQGPPSIVDQMTTRAYVSQFSADGSLFIASFQGSNIKIYNVENGWKVQKRIAAKSLRWTITDTSLSPDQRYLAYSSMSPIVHIVNVTSASTESLANVNEIHEGLDFSGEDDQGYLFGIFSLKFSTDGREIVAGSSNDSIYVYDLEANKLSLRILAHTCDVNTVCFADESGHIIFSGSDDSLCKVWDRRCFKSNGEPAGTLVGHLEGITCIDSRGDGRYFISNGKDQMIKLWDIRKMSSNSKGNNQGYRNYEWDYRWMEYPSPGTSLNHPDQSVATYRGHAVLRTLIRCYFSPVYSTGQRYIYTGSHDACVYIYDVVTGARVRKLEHHMTTVRDCSWHPYYPMLVSSSWDGDIAKWDFPGNEL